MTDDEMQVVMGFTQEVDDLITNAWDFHFGDHKWRLAYAEDVSESDGDGGDLLGEDALVLVRDDGRQFEIEIDMTAREIKR